MGGRRIEFISYIPRGEVNKLVDHRLDRIRSAKGDGECKKRHTSTVDQMSSLGLTGSQFDLSHFGLVWVWKEWLAGGRKEQ